jgi:FHS family L-fucose permease-like MFS transporter
MKENGMVDQRQAGSGARTAFITVTCLFFAWGAITSNNDPLIAALRAIYSLSYTEALLTQFAFFLAYGVVSLPAAAVLGRLGHSRTILASLALMVAACLLVQLSSAIETYSLALLALFLLASGITALQVAANPLAALLGAPERSHFRLTLAQSFNSLGVVFGVHVGSRVMLSGDQSTITDPVARLAAHAAVDRAFLLIAIFLVGLMALIWFTRRRIDDAAPPGDPLASPLAALKSRWAMFGALSIFLYVGAEVAIGSLMINFLNQPGVLGVPLATAGAMLANFYWGGALVGRFIGSFLLTRVAAPRLLGGAAAMAALLSLLAFALEGPAAAYCALGVGLFNSIMFPTIFSITLERSGAPSASTSGLLCMAIVGGAILPYLAGSIADAAGLGAAFIIPAVAYVGIVTFAAAAARRRIVNHPDAAVASSPH